MAMLTQLAGGRGGRGGVRGGAAGRPQDEPAKMTIGVDTRTNSLIIAAPEVLVRRGQEAGLVIDKAAEKSKDIVQVVPIKGTTSTYQLRYVLASIMGNKATCKCEAEAPGQGA